MARLANNFRVIEVTSDNVDEAGVFCIKNKKARGYLKKVNWFKNKINQGLKIRIITDEAGKQLGFIEYMPSELAWRPINAKNSYFIQCIVVFSKQARNNNLGSFLIGLCEQEAKKNNKSGICTMTSKGPWIANKDLFTKNGFEVVDQLDRFELMHKSFSNESPTPKFNDWNAQQNKYKGWNLIYAGQCPWHDKSVKDIHQAAANHGIDLKVTKLATPKEAQNAPSGFGTYSLIRNGKLLADHYISKTRFENILNKEL